MKKMLQKILLHAIMFLSLTIILFALATVFVESHQSFGNIGMLINSVLFVSMFYIHGYIESRKGREKGEEDNL